MVEVERITLICLKTRKFNLSYRNRELKKKLFLVKLLHDILNFTHKTYLFYRKTLNLIWFENL